MTCDIQNLLQSSQSLNAHILPSKLAPVSRNLDQIEQITKRIQARNAGRQGNAAFMLQSKGFKTEKVSENLKRLLPF